MGSDQSLLIATEVRALEQFLAGGLELLDGAIEAQPEIPLVAARGDGLAGAIGPLDGVRPEYERKGPLV
jgi:hypothetical protein